MKKWAFACSLLFIGVFSSMGFDVPVLINYQGRLINGTNLVNDVVTIRVDVYDQATEGTRRYCDLNIVNVIDGLYNLVIGDDTNCSTQYTFKDALLQPEVYLQIVVDGQVLTPRERVTAGAYAVMAGGAADRSITSIMLATGAVQTLNLSTGAVTEEILSERYWKLTGNTNATEGAHFIGTRNNAPLDIRVNNARALRIEPGTTPNIVAGAAENTASPGVVGAVIAGGGRSDGPNQILANHGFIGGGYSNRVEGECGVAAGGFLNTASSLCSVVVGGLHNQAGGIQSSVGGGYENMAVGDTAVVGGGAFNRADGPGAVIAGGNNNRAKGKYSTIAGGGGFDSEFSIAYSNEARGAYAAIGGGGNNSVTGYMGVIAGGAYNLAGRPYSSVGGGQSNQAEGAYSVVAGGHHNSASGTAANVVGGERNDASGAFSAIPGGSANRAAGSYSLSAGRRAQALHNGAMVFSDSTDEEFTSTAANQFLIRAGGHVGIGTNVTPARLTVAGNTLVYGSVTAQTFTGNGSGLTNVQGGTISPSSIGAAQIANLAVETRHLQDGAVSLDKIDTNTVDTQYVNVSGDTMTGPLQLSANGLRVGELNLIVTNSRIGIGTADPAETLTVNGSLQAGLFLGNGIGLTNVVGVPRTGIILSEICPNDILETAGFAPVASNSGNTGWTEVTNNAAWGVRGDFAMTVFSNTLWLTGGSGLNDVWKSIDGATWTLVTNSATWSGRDGHNLLAFEDAMWLMGGVGAGLRRDVWKSTDGAAWTLITTNAAWSGRSHARALVHQRKMWIMGGWDGSYASDVWSSSDGSNWTRATAAAWPGRTYFAADVYNGKMWVLGGQNGSDITNDVWTSTDGITWDVVTREAAWSPRLYHSVAVHANRLWVMGGSTGGYTNDVWHSPDGLNWTPAAEADWAVRGRHTSFDFGGYLWVIGGCDPTCMNDVWRSGSPVTLGPFYLYRKE